MNLDESVETFFSIFFPPELRSATEILTERELAILDKKPYPTFLDYILATLSISDQNTVPQSYQAPPK